MNPDFTPLNSLACARVNLHVVDPDQLRRWAATLAVSPFGLDVAEALTEIAHSVDAFRRAAEEARPALLREEAVP
jgi:hypothetical protein